MNDFPTMQDIPDPLLLAADLQAVGMVKGLVGDEQAKTLMIQAAVALREAYMTEEFGIVTPSWEDKPQWYSSREHAVALMRDQARNAVYSYMVVRRVAGSLRRLTDEEGGIFTADGDLRG